MGDYRIGVDVGGTKIAFGLFDENGTIRQRAKIRTDCEWNCEEFTERINRQIRKLLADQRIADDELKGISLVFPSSVDAERGVVGFTPTIKAIDGFHATEVFSALFPGTQVVIDNDTNAAALAEYTRGAGKGHLDMVFTAFSTGIGSGLILGGKLYRGIGGAAGETGHMIINPLSKESYCGCHNPGCVMGMASGSCVAHRVADAIRAGQKSRIAELVENPDQISAIEIKQAAEEGDPYALSVISDMGRYFGLCLYNIYCVLNVKCFVVGGGLTNFGNLLMDCVKNTFFHYIEQLHGNNTGVELLLAETGSDMGIIGAYQLLCEK